MSTQINDLVLYTVNEISKMLDVQPSTIRMYLRTGKIPGKKFARRWYVTEENLKAYFISQIGPIEQG